MNRLAQWTRFFENHKYPCFINVKSTKELVYCNDSFLELYKVQDGWHGKKFYDVISFNSIQASKEFPDWEIQDVFETETYNKEKNRRFLVRSSKIFDDDTIFNEIIPLDSKVEENSVFEQAMTRCVNIYQNTEDSKTVLNSFTELLAEFHNSQVAFIYRFHKNDYDIEPLTSWVADDFEPSENTIPKLGKKRVYEWFTSPATPSIIICDRNNNNDDIFLHDIMETFFVKNIVFCKIENNVGETIGVVGVSNRRESSKYVDFRLISTISRFVSQHIAKESIDTKLFELHYRDTLTGMYNRECYAQKVESITKNPPKTLGLISINMNGLKVINETIGINEGDNHIKKATECIKEFFDYCFYRLSGDEFVGIATDVDEEEFEKQVVLFHEKMRSEENQDFAFGHSFGRGNYDFNKLIQEAEVIMYINKQEYYSNTKRTMDTIKDSILADLLSFLKNDEFMIYLQPQVKLKDASLYGAEALIRRFDKTNNKMVFPDQFIPLYEQKSIIRHVDMFVVDSVCKLLKQWGDIGKALPISVNLSRVTLQEFGIVESIIEICDKYEVPHNLLVIEVTERVGLIENNVASSLITAFKENGFNISLDDFGCAYSNIVTLAQIEVDEVKIDKSLVDDLTTNKKNHILVKNMLTMCNELEGASTLAEGIEDEHQAKLLFELGCHLGQGYYYSRPIPVPDFEKEYIIK